MAFSYLQGGGREVEERERAPKREDVVGGLKAETAREFPVPVVAFKNLGVSRVVRNQSQHRVVEKIEMRRL